MTDPHLALRWPNLVDPTLLDSSYAAIIGDGVAGNQYTATLAQIISAGAPIFSVKASGAFGTGDIDDTLAIRRAVLRASAAGGVVYFPCGTYLVSDTITIAAVGVRLVGDGNRASFILFNPATSKVCLDWINSNAAQTLSNCGLSDLGAISTNTIQKTWCRYTDISDFNEDRVIVYSSWTSTGKDSIGYEHRGRELYHTRNYTNFADRTYVFSQNPRDSTTFIDSDSYTFENGYVRAATTQYAFYFDPTLRSVQSPKFDGGTCVGGAGVFQWNGAGATLDSPGWLIKDWRSEQMTGSSGWFCDFSRDANTIVAPQFINIAPSLTNNGFRMRRTTLAYWNTIRWSDTTGVTKLWDRDSTNTKLFHENVWTQTGGAVTDTGLTQVWGLTRQNSPDMAIPMTGYYDTATNGATILGNIVKMNASTRLLLPSDGLGYYDSTNTTLESRMEANGQIRQITAGIVLPLRKITANDSATVADYTIIADATTGNITLALPDVNGASVRTKMELVVKKTDATANTVTIDPAGAQTIEGAATYVLTAQNQSVIIQADDVGKWYILGKV